MAAYEAGDYVKIEVSDECTGESEWMWLKVERCDEVGRLVFGRLDNIPVLNAAQLRLSQELAVSFDNIRDHLKR